MSNGFNNTQHYKGRAIAWVMGSVVVLAFIAGPMVDLDHPLALVLGIHNGRFLHPAFAIAGLSFIGAGLILVVACFCRYLQLRLLKK